MRKGKFRSVYLLHAMGCCCLCHPATDVEQDPSVSSYTEAEDIVITRGLRTVLGVAGCCTQSGGTGGLMYIQGDSLYCEAGCCGKYNLCCKCWKQRFKLSSIEVVDIFDNQTLPVGLCCRNIQLSPGLRISVDPNVTIFVATPDATRFGQLLAKASNTVARAVWYGRYTESYKLMPMAKRKRAVATTHNQNRIKGQAIAKEVK